MGISPIVNLTPLPMARSVQAELEPAPMERVERSARTGDETYTPNRGKAARGSEDAGGEDDGTQDDFEDQQNQNETQSATPPVQGSENRQVSFFA